MSDFMIALRVIEVTADMLSAFALLAVAFEIYPARDVKRRKR